MTEVALIVAGGRGQRFAGDGPKQFAPLGGRPVLRWSVQALQRCAHTIVVVPADQFESAHAACAGAAVTLTAGGATRTASVRAGLALVPPDTTTVLIHDAARPGVRQDVLARLRAALAEGADGAAPALPLADALKRTDAANWVSDNADRTGLMRVQTPQMFRFPALAAAYAALPEHSSLDDDIAVATAAGLRVQLVAGDPRLSKITYPEDLAMVERLMGQQRLPCVGSGADAHRFGPGDHVTLCGVRIPHSHGLIGHSDADAGWHALTDALLGAIAAGDIGQHFPPSDPQWRGAASERFLAHAASLVRQRGAEIANVDLTILCESPKIGPHRAAMQARTAEVLGLSPDRVGIKATTTERMGFLGRQEGLAALASALVLRWP